MFISHIRKTVGFWDIGEMGFSRDKKIIMKNYKGVIIEESLENTDVLSKVRIVRTKVEKVTKKHKTPWIKEWTLHTVHIPEKKAASIAKKLSKSLDSKHSWYADFRSEVTKKHKTPWIKEWTLHTVHIPEKKAASIAKKLSKSLDSKHSWYADF